MKNVLVLSIFLGFLPFAGFAADNAVLITFDGLRWQEVFSGLDRELATHEEFSEQSELILERFWRDSADERAEALLPFLHNTVFRKGSFVGNRDAGSCAEVTNDWYFSYPGYSEILLSLIHI